MIIGLKRAAALCALLGVAACGNESSTGPSAPPAAMRATAGDGQTGAVGTALPVALAVTVTAVDGKPVSGATVSWDVAPGSGSVTTANTRTDGNGRTQVTWTLGANAGTARVTAQVGGVPPVPFSATALPGSASTIVALPDTLYLGVGDTVTVVASARDEFGNVQTATTSTFTSTAGTVASVNGSGLVTAAAIGTARIVVGIGAKADTVPVTVAAAGASPCGNLAAQSVAVGQVLSATSRVCLSSGATNAEYGLVAFASNTAFGTTTSFDVYGLGVLRPTAPIMGGVQSGLTAGSLFNAAYDTFGAANPSLLLNRDAERVRRENERRELAPLVDIAREAFGARSGRGNGADSFPFGKPVALRAAPNVGDVLKLNAQALQGCTNAAIKNGVVKAVGTHSIVVADPENPTGGYSDADYRAFAATFDTLVYPLDTENFGIPTDISGYGKIILFFTTAVNKLTPRYAGYVIGGFFFARDLYPKTARSGLAACSASNEAEMFYLLVPDPSGTINFNQRSIADVNRLNLTTLAHEMQHLINASRRLYVNTGAAASEETWLDEGLSHVAEELLYYRISGHGSRDNLDLMDVGGTSTQATYFSSYMLQNFGRLYERLRNPENTSPYAPNDSLSTRGAIWSFLRYAAGRQPSVAAEATFFRSLVNSTATGVANLNSVLPSGQLTSYLNDWSVATLTDDYALLPQDQLDDRYKFPSWNFRSIYPNLRFGSSSPLGVYPLGVRALRSNESQRISLAGGGAAYLRFAVGANKTGVISLSNNGVAASGTLKFSIVRLR